MPLRLAFVFFAFCFLGVVSAAKADCISDCMAGKDCSLNYSGACSSALSDCSQECVGGGSSGGAYGAIAYDRASGAFGYAYQLPDEDAAGRFAMKKCAAHGEGCEVIVTFADACAALAAGSKDGKTITFTVVSDGEEAAQAKAVANCTKDGAKDCEIEVWSCSYR